MRDMSEIECSCTENKNDLTQREILWPPGPRTDDVYRTCGLPMRFMYPKALRGYREDEGSSTTPHPCYRSTAMDYGWFAPTIHTVPTTYYPRNNSFSSELASAGMYRNRSLNTELDKSLF